MGLIDTKLCYTLQSDGTIAQALTATADSTNHVNLGEAGKDKGEPFVLLCQVVQDFTDNSGSDLTLTVAIHDSADDSSFAAVVTSAAIGVATLVAGYKFRIAVPYALRQYSKLVFTIANGTATGKIVAGLVLEHQTNG